MIGAYRGRERIVAPVRDSPCLFFTRNAKQLFERSTVDVAHTEMVEAELTAFIERRAKSNPDPDETEASYMESVRRYHARNQRAHLEEQRLFHRRKLAAHADNFTRLVAQHRVATERCEELLGKQPETKGDDAA